MRESIERRATRLFSAFMLAGVLSLGLSATSAVALVAIFVGRSVLFFQPGGQA